MLRSMVLKPGENPRQMLPGHKERGPVPHGFTLADIAKAAGVGNQTVRKAITDKRLDPSDLASVAAYVNRGLARKSKPLEEEAVGLLPAAQKKWWKNRWPKFQLYKCSHNGCPELLMSPGACAAHGGDKRPAMKLDPDYRIVVLIDKDYVPLHRLIVQAAKGMHTHHRDGNPWNNRWDNLEELSPKEHEDRHLGGVLTAETLPKPPPRKPLRGEATRKQIQALIDDAFVRGCEAGAKKKKK